jgi:hypothetical protein
MARELSAKPRNPKFASAFEANGYIENPKKWTVENPGLSTIFVPANASGF